ncbi:MAG TPA: hypothetical protein VFC93_06620 [Chloroflexota bacterium]|nr:hypothetical protein [Chloroflexota bacterium]
MPLDPLVVLDAPPLVVPLLLVLPDGGFTFTLGATFMLEPLLEAGALVATAGAPDGATDVVRIPPSAKAQTRNAMINKATRTPSTVPTP